MVVAMVLMGDNFSSCRSANVRCMLCGEGGCGGGDDGGHQYQYPRDPH